MSTAPKRQRAKGKESAESLMTTAIDLFSERDYASVTIQDITQRAGVAHSLVYYHFKNKEALFSAAITDLIEKTHASYRVTRQAHNDPVDLIEDWFDNNVKLANALRKLVKIMFVYSRPSQGAPSQGSPSVVDAIRSFYEAEHAVIEENIKKGIDQGLFKNVDAAQVARFVSTHIDGIFYDSFIRSSHNIEQGMDDLKGVLWTILGYEGSGKEE